MNFKLGFFKVIISLILGVLGGYFRSMLIRSGVVFNSFEKFILPSLIIFVIVYIIISLMQRKRIVR